MLRTTKTLLAALLAVTAIGCSQQKDGTANLRMKAVVSSGLVDSAQVWVDVVGTADNGAPVAIHAQLAATDGVYETLLQSVPVGTYQVHGFAGPSGNPGEALYANDAQVRLTPGANPVLVMVLQQVGPAQTVGNAAPQIDGVFFSTVAPAPGDTVHIVAFASDADGDPLSVAWTDGAGNAFAPADALDTQWIAQFEGEFTITLRVWDPKGASAGASYRVSVSAANARATLPMALSVNNWPAIAEVAPLAGNAQVPPGTPIGMYVVAADADGDPLAYSWTASCPGWFADLSGDGTQVQFNPDLSYGTFVGACRLAVVVSDGRGGATEGYLVVNFLDPAYAVAPQFDYLSQTKTYVGAGESAVFRAMAHDPQGLPMDFRWTVDGAPVGGATPILDGNGVVVGSELVWYPTCTSGATSFAIGVEVVNGTPVSNAYTFRASACGEGTFRYAAQFDYATTPYAQCTSWDAFRASLVGPFSSVTLAGSNDPVGVSCTGPEANTICQALHDGVEAWVPCNGRTWTVSLGCSTNGYAAVELSANGDRCQCSSGYDLRACIFNENWGGIAGPTCYAPTQTIEVTCGR